LYCHLSCCLLLLLLPHPLLLLPHPLLLLLLVGLGPLVGHLVVLMLRFELTEGQLVVLLYCLLLRAAAVLHRRG
jgi:hypothetical protein